MIEPLGITLELPNSLDISNLSITPGELHLWWLPLTISDVNKEFTLSLLNDKQRSKYNRKSPEHLKEAYLAGRYYLFTLLAAYKKCKPHEINLSYSRLNKPSLVGESHIQFNFTDTVFDKQSYGLFAFCLDKEVGVDLEALNRKSDFSRIAQRRFTKQEFDYVSENTGQVSPEKCLAIWTRKEAYGKAIGKGINFQMNERNLVSSSSFTHNFNDENGDWRLLQIQPDPRFIASVVHQGHYELRIKAFNSLNQIA